ncbi:hypothetical protein Pmani_018040 [Petrolisthes manimaculis]|uniref:Uncharacterized protein n=1 Tax=Petrolisthes manimaculis TaxID=1843537 RepID=A0AAE1PL64_9EUCA|nr:hypothetical protein Pmani_018040 [Petrolisthes manimaculis]
MKSMSECSERGRVSERLYKTLQTLALISTPDIYQMDRSSDNKTTFIIFRCDALIREKDVVFRLARSNNRTQWRPLGQDKPKGGKIFPGILLSNPVPGGRPVWCPCLARALSGEGPPPPPPPPPPRPSTPTVVPLPLHLHP